MTHKWRKIIASFLFNISVISLNSQLFFQNRAIASEHQSLADFIHNQHWWLIITSANESVSICIHQQWGNCFALIRDRSTLNAVIYVWELCQHFLPYRLASLRVTLSFERWLRAKDCSYGFVVALNAIVLAMLPFYRPNLSEFWLFLFSGMSICTTFQCKFESSIATARILWCSYENFMV